MRVIVRQAMVMQAWQERCTGMCAPNSWTLAKNVGVPRDGGIP